MYTKKNIYETNNKKEKGNEKEKENKKKPIKRGSVAMQQINLLFKNDQNKDEEIIDSLIKEREKNRRRYSQSLIMPYIPLTRKEKVKEIVNMDKTSANRFNEYSQIFDHIKNQISDINNSLLSGNILNNSHHNIDSFSNKMSSSRQKIKIENSMFKPDNNEEKDNNLNSKLKSKKINHIKNKNYINNNLNYNNNNNNYSNNIIIGLNNSDDEDDDYIDNKTLDENIRHIYLNYSPAPNSLRLTKTKNRQFITKFKKKNNENNSKTDKRFILRNNSHNNKDFYFEPTLDGTDKNRYSTEIKEIKYCKCIIF